MQISISEAVRKSMGSMNFEKVLHPAQSFGRYMDSRLTADHLYKQIEKTPGINIVNTKENTDYIKQCLAVVVKPIIYLSKSTIRKDQETFNAAIDKIDNFEKIDSVYPARDAAIQAISKEHKLEKDTLSEQLQDPNLLESLGVDPKDATKVEQVKKNMLDFLEQNQKKEIETFTKNVSDSLINMHNEAWRIVTLKHILTSKGNEGLLRNLEARIPQPEGINIANQNADNAAFSALVKGITPKMLASFKTPGGSTATFEGDTLKVQFPNRVYSFLFGRDATMGQDMESLARAVRANGHDSITMSVEHNNPEYANKMAREAYLACCATGFDPKKITININGTVTALEAFAKKDGKEDPSFAKGAPSFKVAAERAYANAKATEGQAISTIYKSSEFKTHLQGLKASQPVAAPQSALPAVEVHQAPGQR